MLEWIRPLFTAWHNMSTISAQIKESIVILKSRSMQIGPR